MSDTVFEAKEEEPRSTARGQWHRLLGKLLELLLTPVGITVQTEVQVMSESPRVDVVLLRRDGERWTEKQLRLLCDGLRNAIAKLLMLEFKYSESLNKEALVQALSYDYFYRQTQQLGEDAVECFVMVARTPQAKTLSKFGYTVSEQAGVYRTNLPAFDRVTVIVLNELSNEPQNAFVQLLASKRRVRNSAFARLQAADKEEPLAENLWELLFGLQGQYTLGEEAMSKRVEVATMTPEMVMKLGRMVRQAVAASLTPEERLASLTPEERLAGLAPEERLASLTPEERLAGLAPEERLAGLAPEERLASLTPEERLAGLAPEERLASLTPEERLAGLEPEERLAGLEPEERLAGLAPEEMEQIVEKVPVGKRLVGLKPEELTQLMAQIEAYLQQQGKPSRPR